MREPKSWQRVAGSTQPQFSNTHDCVQPYHCSHQQLNQQMPQGLELHQKVEMPCQRTKCVRRRRAWRATFATKWTRLLRCSPGAVSSTPSSTLAPPHKNPKDLLIDGIQRHTNDFLESNSVISTDFSTIISMSRNSTT
ncbi:hypothetical protein CDAR_424781 [Caerostris darwini]|uniref:Uncharacterized protein n=1 Tax=Caerostris darwini TaxID=1538125 RepID=A0AAV4WFF5_9ARAC|nr:hypothetical protein CDAR_424781 [Caerostris darwini]